MILSYNVDDVIDDTIYVFKKHIEEHPEGKVEIVRRLMWCFLENMRTSNSHLIPRVLNEILTCINKQDIMQNIKFIEMNIIPSLDNPNGYTAWKEIQAHLKN